MTKLTDKAMLVGLHISTYGGYKHDKTVSREVAANHNSDIEMGRFNKSLVDRGALAPIGKAEGELRNYLYEQTLPWASSGARILPSANYWDFTAGVRERKAKFETAVAAFLAAFDDHKAEAQRRLGDLYRESDYPSRRDLERRFSVEVTFDALPDAADWRVALGADEEAAIREDIEKRTTSALAEAHASLWKRAHDVVSHMVERLEAYKVETGPDGKTKTTGKFHDTLISNARELCGLLPKLNITGDPELERVRLAIEARLCKAEAQDLRDSDALRKSVAKDAAAILAEMAAYCGPVMSEAAE